MPRRSQRASSDDPWIVLGLPPGSPAAAIQEARRELAKRAHPDVGGSVGAMQQINDAAAAALREVTRERSAAGGRAADPSPAGRSHQRTTDRGAPPGLRHDHPSFTVEALPVETYEGLLVVASWLGEVMIDDPPYLLEVALTTPARGWCRLDVVPDAGSSTISLAVAAEPGYPVPDLDAVRDAWIDGLNRLDWTDLPDRSGGQQPW